MIVATSQQSRFKTEALDAAAFSKDVDLKQVNIAVGDRELLVDGHLKLFNGVHYALIGRNGTGKSTLLKSLGYGLLVGLPHHIRALYVDQLEGEDIKKSVVQVVLQSDQRSDQLLKQTALLSEALGAGSVDDVVQALRQLQLDRLEERLAFATKIATHRSGQRGLAARQIQVALERDLAAARAARKDQATAEEVGEALDEAQGLLDAMYDELDAIDADSAEARARAILVGLGFTIAQQDGPLEQLSGGWRMRVALAKALFLKPDLLLLDEPTNHLDMAANLWLASYLRQLEDVTLVVVSHDRAFLNAVTHQTIVLKDGQLHYYAGNYDEYIIAREERREAAEKQSAALQKKREHIEKSIADGVRNAKKTGDDNKLGMVASRKKKLERLGAEKNEKGHRFRLQKDMVGFHFSVRSDINRDVEDAAVVFKFPKPTAFRSKGSLLQLEDVGFRYPGGSSPILQHVTLNVQPGQRLAFVGANGQGKSTLIKLITGALTPSTGTITLHREAIVGVFSQHSVEQMMDAASAYVESRASYTSDEEKGSRASELSTGLSSKPATHLTAVDWLQQQHPAVTESELRTLLSQFGIRGDIAKQPLESLSGGQAVRVAMVNSVAKKPHLLVLDEVSNHLDMDTVEGLAEALQAYSGALLLVSHDQWLVQQAVGDQVYLVGNGVVRQLDGGVQQYVKMLTNPKGSTKNVPAKSLRQQAREQKKALGAKA